MSLTSRNAAIADALTTWLNDGARPWTGLFTATRIWTTQKQIAEIDTATPLVEVLALSEKILELLSRNNKTQDYVSLIVWRQHYTPPGNAANAAVPNSWVDGIVAQAESVRDALTAAPTLQLASQPAGYTVFLRSAEMDLGDVGPALQDFATVVIYVLVTWQEIRPR